MLNPPATAGKPLAEQVDRAGKVEPQPRAAVPQEVKTRGGGGCATGGKDR